MKKLIFLTMILLVSVTACDKIAENAKRKAPTGSSSQTEAIRQERIKHLYDELQRAKAMIPPLKTGTVTVKMSGGKSAVFKVEAAEKPEQQAFGLMLRHEMPADAGMIFIWEKPRVAEFWMKNTLIALDMMFIAEDGKIVMIKKNALPMSETRISSGVPVIAVLEVNGGTAEKFGIKEGDTVSRDINK